MSKKRIPIFLFGLCFVLSSCNSVAVPTQTLTDEEAEAMTKQYFTNSLLDPEGTYDSSSEEFKKFMTLDGFKYTLSVIPYVDYEDFLFDRIRNTQEYVSTSTGDGMASTIYVYGEMVVTNSLNVETNVQWIYDEGEGRWEMAGVNVTNPYE